MTALLALALAVVVALVGVSAVTDETSRSDALAAALRASAERRRQERERAERERAERNAAALRQLRRPGVPPAIVGVGRDERWVG